MAFDALTLSVLTDEFKKTILGGKINKIYQPEKDEIVLSVFNGKSFKLLISANAGVNRIHLTDKNTDNPAVAPNFCMLLRKHITNAQITQISQVPFERVVDFTLLNKNELGYQRTMHLIFELTGKTSNIILAEENYLVLDSIKHLPQDINSTRLIMPGVKYTFFPPRDKLAPDDPKIANLVTFSNLPLRKYLSETVLGVSSVTVNEVTYGIDENNHSEINAQRIVSAFQQYLTKLEHPHPVILYNEKGVPTEVLPFPYLSKKGNVVTYETLNEAHDDYFYLLDKAQRFADKAKSVSTVIKNAIARTEKKLAIQRQSVLEGQQSLQFKKYGDLILANLYRIKRNDREVTVTDYYDENCPEITVTLDPSMDGTQNAQHYYKKYRKMKSTVEHNTKLIEENSRLLDYLNTVKQSLKYCNETADLAEIVKELEDAGIIKYKKVKKETLPPSKPLTYNIEGYTVLVGKNNIQNNLVTYKLAKPDDMWLHTQQIHSSHVVISGKNIPDDVIVKSAEITAYYSQAREGSKIAVDYTRRENVRKPPKGAIGSAFYTSYNTVIVNPNQHPELLVKEK